MNSRNAEYFIRSASAPAIRAGVMIAKVIWKNMYTVSGMVGARAVLAMFMSRVQRRQQEVLEVADVRDCGPVKAIE